MNCSNLFRLGLSIIKQLRDAKMSVARADASIGLGKYVKSTIKTCTKVFGNGQADVRHKNPRKGDRIDVINKFEAIKIHSILR